MTWYKPRNESVKCETGGREYVDHCVGDVELGKVNWGGMLYKDVFGFKMIITFYDSGI